MLLMHASQAETTTGTSTSVHIDNAEIIGLFVNVTAVSGVLPTLIVKLQHSPNDTDWYDVGGIVTNTLNALGLYDLSPSADQRVGDYVRVKWTIGGVGPSFTFTASLSVSGGAL